MPGAAPSAPSVRLSCSRPGSNAFIYLFVYVLICLCLYLLLILIHVFNKNTAAAAPRLRRSNGGAAQRENASQPPSSRVSKPPDSLRSVLEERRSPRLRREGLKPCRAMALRARPTSDSRAAGDALQPARGHHTAALRMPSDQSCSRPEGIIRSIRIARAFVYREAGELSAEEHYVMFFETWR